MWSAEVWFMHLAKESKKRIVEHSINVAKGRRGKEIV
jgi:hypothetical protein